MKKTIWIIVGIVALIAGIVYALKKFFMKPQIAKTITDNKNIVFTPIQAFNACKVGADNDELMALNVAERIYHLESANFTSNIYKNTLGAGMLAFTEDYPYGWIECKNLWENAKVNPLSTYHSTNGLNYVKFPHLVTGIMTVIQVLYVNQAAGLGPASHYGSQDANYLQKLTNIDSSNLITESFPNNPYLN